MLGTLILANIKPLKIYGDTQIPKTWNDELKNCKIMVKQSFGEFM